MRIRRRRLLILRRRDLVMEFLEGRAGGMEMLVGILGGEAVGGMLLLFSWFGESTREGACELKLVSTLS